MNNTRRKQINKLREQLAEIEDNLQIVLEEEEGARDNLPESLQDARAEEFDTAIDQLNEAIDSVEAAGEALEVIE